MMRLMQRAVLMIVTPDGERSMNTYLGVTEFLTSDDIDVDPDGRGGVDLSGGLPL